MMRFMKRNRRSSVGKVPQQQQEAGPNNPPVKIFSNKSNKECRLDTVGSTGDDSSTAEPSDEAWRVENFLDGPPQDDDWWWSEDTEDESGGKDEENNTNSRAKRASNNSKEIKLFSRRRSSSTTNSNSKRFRNKGLETWEKTRQAWTTAHSSKRSTGAVVVATSASSFSSPLGRNKLVSHFRRRELHRNLMTERHYVLPNPMNLKDLVGVYTTDIWNKGHNDT